LVNIQEALKITAKASSRIIVLFGQNGASFVLLVQFSQVVQA
jgi:hypothetical protein